jgi:hypothetical protein
MATLLLSVIPLLGILAVFVYALVTGMRAYRSEGHVSILGVAVTIAGLTLGRLVDRLVPLPQYLDDWVNLRGSANSQIRTGGERFLAVLSVEVALLFLFAAAIGFLAVTMIRRDAAGRLRFIAHRGGFSLLATLFAFAVGITVRSKLAALLAFLMAKANLL